MSRSRGNNGKQWSRSLPPDLAGDFSPTWILSRLFRECQEIFIYVPVPMREHYGSDDLVFHAAQVHHMLVCITITMPSHDSLFIFGFRLIILSAQNYFMSLSKAIFNILIIPFIPSYERYRVTWNRVDLSKTRGIKCEFFIFKQMT